MVARSAAVLALAAFSGVLAPAPAEATPPRRTLPVACLYVEQTDIEAEVGDTSQIAVTLQSGRCDALGIALSQAVTVNAGPDVHAELEVVGDHPDALTVEAAPAVGPGLADDESGSCSWHWYVHSPEIAVLEFRITVTVSPVPGVIDVPLTLPLQTVHLHVGGERTAQAPSAADGPDHPDAPLEQTSVPVPPPSATTTSKPNATTSRHPDRQVDAGTPSAGTTDGAAPTTSTTRATPIPTPTPTPTVVPSSDAGPVDSSIAAVVVGMMVLVLILILAVFAYAYRRRSS